MANQFYWSKPEPGTPWDKVRIYQSTTTIDGTYSLLETLEITRGMYVDEPGLPAYWYRVAYYDSKNNIQSDLSTGFQVGSVPILSITELRRFMALDCKDPPDDTIIAEFINDAHTEEVADTEGYPGITASQLRLGLKFLSGYYVAKWLSRHFLRGGSSEFSIDGVNIKKPGGIWNMQAEDLLKRYNGWLMKFASEVTWTHPMADAGYQDYGTDLTDILAGINNARNRLDLRSINGWEVPVIPSE